VADEKPGDKKSEDDSEVAPEEKVERRTVKAVQDDLNKANDELADLRAQREQAQREAVEQIQVAQLEAELANVRREIDNEKAMLDNQQNIDAGAVATGIPTDENPAVTEVNEPTATEVTPVDNTAGDTDAEAPAPEIPPAPTEDEAPSLQTQEYGVAASAYNDNNGGDQ
jgi:type II secretory pathway pseudopilin PulG